MLLHPFFVFIGYAQKEDLNNIHFAELTCQADDKKIRCFDTGHTARLSNKNCVLYAVFIDDHTDLALTHLL